MAWPERAAPPLAPLPAAVPRQRGRVSLAWPAVAPAAEAGARARSAASNAFAARTEPRSVRHWPPPRPPRLFQHLAETEICVPMDDSSDIGAVDEFLATKREDGLPNDEWVQDCYPMSEEGLAVLEELIEHNRPRGPVTMGILKVWDLWELRGLPRALRAPPQCPAPLARLQNPSAEELFECVLRNQPAVITGAVDEQGFPPLCDFADTHYLRARCGDQVVGLKAGPLLDGGAREVFMTDPNHQVRFRDYLAHLDEAESRGAAPSLYMGKSRLNDVLPELVEDIEYSPASPMALYGSCFGRNYQGVFTYFGCGRNTTGVHCDPGENLLIVICGTKRFDLFPPTDVDCLYPFAPPKHLCAAVPPLISPDNMPLHLKSRCPLYRHTQPIRVDLKAGDMLYLPIFWWHGVTGSVERNMILNWWCDPHPQKARTGDESTGARFVCKDIAIELSRQEGAGADHS